MMTRRRTLTLAAALPVAALSFSLPAQVAAALTPEEVSAVLQAEVYLNQIRTMQSRFVQVSSNGAFSEGELFINRPGKLRFEYDPPNPVLLIADGFSLLYYDKELKQSTFIPLWETPLWFLIRDEVNLSGKVEIEKVERGRGSLRLTMRERGASEEGTVTLVFSETPFALRKWEITDGQGITSQISLIDPRIGHELDETVFDYSDLNVHNLGKRPNR